MAIEEEPSPNILTLRINIHDKEKVKWIWEGMKFAGPPNGTEDMKRFIEQYGCTVTMVSWGDPYNEKEYILDRIDKYLSRWDRDDLLEEMGLEHDTHDEMGQLEELIERWTKDARELYGMDVTHEMVWARALARREAKQLELKGLENVKTTD